MKFTSPLETNTGGRYSKIRQLLILRKRAFLFAVRQCETPGRGVGQNRLCSNNRYEGKYTKGAEIEKINGILITNPLYNALLQKAMNRDPCNDIPNYTLIALKTGNIFLM